MVYPKMFLYRAYTVFRQLLWNLTEPIIDDFLDKKVGITDFIPAFSIYNEDKRKDHYILWSYGVPAESRTRIYALGGHYSIH